MRELQPRVAIYKTSGINCDAETAFAFNLAGGKTEIVMSEDLKKREKKLSDYKILTFPGGFSFGDDLGSGTVAALELDTYLEDQIQRFKETGLILGICNGLQILGRSGLLPIGTLRERQATLDRNNSGKFLGRPIRLSFEKSRCVFLQDLESNGPIELQIAHGEGKFVMSPSTISQIEENEQVVFRYVDAKGQPTQEYPFNPNGSPNAIAGITDPSGRILGLMPHPERSILKSQYPNWRRMGDFKPQGLQVFESMVNYAAQM